MKTMALLPEKQGVNARAEELAEHLAVTVCSVSAAAQGFIRAASQQGIGELVNGDKGVSQVAHVVTPLAKVLLLTTADLQLRT